MIPNRVAIIVRLWTEGESIADDKRLIVRASWQQANSNQIHYFSSLDQCLDSIREIAGAHFAAPDDA